MTIRTNKIMDGYLSKIDYNFWEASVSLPADLEKIIQSDFVVDNDCVILKAISNISTNPLFQVSLKKCEWEDSENHFHPDAYIETENQMDYLKIALECGKRLAKRLDSEFKNGNFRIIVSYNETIMVDGEVETYGSSTVRFYQIRPDCEDVMRTNDLNDFVHDALLEIEKLQATCMFM